MTMELLLDWKSVGSLVATVMLIHTTIKQFVPPEVYDFLRVLFSKIFSSIQSKATFVIREYESSFNNELFESVQSYLGSKCLSSANVIRLNRLRNSKNLTNTMDTNQEVEETFDGIKLKWTLRTVEKNHHENRVFELSFHKKYVHKIHSSYIPHVVEEAEKIKFKIRERKLYTNRSYDGERLWTSVPFTHPASFETLAMDPVLKRGIMEDLMKFVRRREFYKRVGRAWKRGYLLYGPPGTGKTSLIAAIANFLEFDIYDLELTSVRDNYQLRKLLISTTKRSVIIIEDVDCTLDLSDRLKKKKKNNINQGEEDSEKEGSRNLASGVSLSGVLNFIDGLWSSCGGERLMIFTTNHKEKLDPALLRPGRMDKHIYLSYCEFSAFKMLAKNYLDIEEHEQMEEVEKMLPNVKMTPADIAEIFMGCDDDGDMGMKSLVEEMKIRLELQLSDSSSIAEKENRTDGGA